MPDNEDSQVEHIEVATSSPAAAAEAAAAATEATSAVGVSDAPQQQQHPDENPAGERIVRPRARTETNTAEIDSTIVRPGSVRINVKGAFIVDTPEGSPTRDAPAGSTAHETKDIRLPNHTAVVSHIAVDVRSFFSSELLLLFFPLFDEIGSSLCTILFSRPANTMRAVDRRLAGQARILLPRGALERTRRPAQLYEL